MSLPSKLIVTGAFADDPHDGAQRCRLADAIAAKQGNRLALMNIEIDAVQRMTFTIPGMKIADGKEWLNYSCSVPI